MFVASRLLEVHEGAADKAEPSLIHTTSIHTIVRLLSRVNIMDLISHLTFPSKPAVADDFPRSLFVGVDLE